MDTQHLPYTTDNQCQFTRVSEKLAGDIHECLVIFISQHLACGTCVVTIGVELSSCAVLKGRTHPALVGNSRTIFLGELNLKRAPSLFQSLGSVRHILWLLSMLSYRKTLLGPNFSIISLASPVFLGLQTGLLRSTLSFGSDFQHFQLECLFSSELWGLCLFSCFHYRLPPDSPKASWPQLS